MVAQSRMASFTFLVVVLFHVVFYLPAVFLGIIHIVVEWYRGLMAQTVKNLPKMWETQVQSLGWGDPLEKGMATHSSILAWRIP